jgi:iron(III) transport system substrate-binding protein
MAVRRYRKLVIALAVAAAAAVAAGSSSGATKVESATAKKAPPPPSILRPGAALNRLVARARAEGSLTFYTVPPDATMRRVVEGFTKRFGVRATWTRFGTADLQTRFSSEQQAGGSPADMILLSNSPFIASALERGWVTPPKRAGLPGWPVGKVARGYPKGFLTNTGTAIVQLQPSAFMYNTRAVSAADAPKNWQDLLDPKWRGKIILTDPTSSPAFVDLWWAVARRNGGMAFLERLRAQARRLYPGVAPLTQALAAGEAEIAVPGVPSIAQPLIDRGAPLAVLTPPVTTGPEIVPMINRNARNPNAARLFTYFLLTPGGQALLNADPGSVSVWARQNLPRQYQRVDSNVSQRSRTDIFRAFGVG